MCATDLWGKANPSVPMLPYSPEMHSNMPKVTQQDGGRAGTTVHIFCFFPWSHMIFWTNDIVASPGFSSRCHVQALSGMTNSLCPATEPKITITLWSGQIPGAGAGYVAQQHKRLESGRVTGE